MPLISSLSRQSVVTDYNIPRINVVVKRFSDNLLRFSVVFFIMQKKEVVMRSLEFYKAKKKELHLTNDKVSEISGLPKRTVEDFFAGISKAPRASTLEAIERALGLYLDDTAREEITVQEYRLLTASPFRHYRHSIKIFARNSGAAFMTFGRHLTRVAWNAMSTKTLANS